VPALRGCLQRARAWIVAVLGAAVESPAIWIGDGLAG
jgi:hypothetical protein